MRSFALASASLLAAVVAATPAGRFDHPGSNFNSPESNSPAHNFPVYHSPAASSSVISPSTVSPSTVSCSTVSSSTVSSSTGSSSTGISTVASNSTADYCLSDTEAQQVATLFGLTLSDYSTAIATATFSVDFEDYNDSVWELINGGCTVNNTLGTVTFASRALFEAGQSAQDDITFEQLNIWHTCQTIFLRWRTPLSPQEVTGIVVMETALAPANNTYGNATVPYQIKTLYSEFNSGAWMVDIDLITPTCSNTTS